MLTPRSRLRYRISRIRFGRISGFDSGDEIAVVALVLRVASLPLLTLADFAAWPVVRLAFCRGPWWVVEPLFHGPDAEFVRIVEASTHDGARAKLAKIEHARARRANA